MNDINQSSRKLIPWVIALAMLIEGLDASILNTSLPKIALSFHQDPLHLKFALTSYLLSLGVFIPASGWMADRFGNKRIFMLAIGIFTMSSIGCGLSQALYQMIIMRILQGLGGAMMMPVGRLILLRMFERTELVKVMNRVVTFALIGPMLGPTLGGFLSEYVSWRWIFFVNAPIGVLGVYLVSKYLGLNEQKAVTKFDFMGFFLFGIGLALLLYAFQLLIDSDFCTEIKVFAFLTSGACLMTYYWQAHRHKHPIVDWHIFETDAFRITAIGGFVSRLGMGATPFLLPLMYQLGLGYSPLYAGLMMFPITLAAAASKSLVQPTLMKFGYRTTILFNTIFLGLMTLQFNWLNANTSLVLVMLILFLYGASASLQFSALNTLMYASVPKHLQASGTSVVSVLQQIAMSFGIAIAAMVLEFLLHSNHLDQMRIPVQYFHITFRVTGLIILFSSLVFLSLHPNVGHEASGYQAKK